MITAEFSDDRWPLPPEAPELKDNEVHVWMVRVVNNRGREAKLTALLSSDERQRASRLKFDKDRRLYIAAHAGLRSLLAEYLRIAPEEICFSAGTHGKPLLERAAANELQFNLSHSHEVALIAVGPGGALGIDVEFVKRDFSFDEVARRFFTTNEVDALFELPRPLQREAFFKCWTSKEAFLKAKATGLSAKLDEVRVVPTDDGSVRIDANVPGWSLMELRPGDGYEAALVVEGRARPARCYRWEPRS
jgi:4'-phosphopantetheinyl transferase